MTSRRPHTIVRPSERFGPHGFDLDTPEDLSDADNDVVAIAISPRLGDGEAESRGFSHEGEFGELAAMFVVELGCVVQLVT